MNQGRTKKAKKRKTSGAKTKYGELLLDEKRIFKVAVVSTMSSGKSTLINALAGVELLPAFNQACTAKTLALLDNDEISSPVGHIIYEDGSYEKVLDCNKEQITAFNDGTGKPISDIVVECDISGIHNAKTALMLIDTPGVNNHLDTKHRATTMKYLKQMTCGLILYLMTPDQYQGNDNDLFLREISQILEKNEGLNAIFVVNKFDRIDPSKEKPFEMMANIADYLKSNGIKEPVIIPISAEASLLMKLALERVHLTESQQDSFEKYYKKFIRQIDVGFDCRNMIWDEKVAVESEILVDDSSYRAIDLTLALEQAGLPTLERRIESAMLQAAHYTAPRTRKTRKV